MNKEIKNIIDQYDNYIIDEIDYILSKIENKIFNDLIISDELIIIEIDKYIRRKIKSFL